MKMGKSRLKALDRMGMRVINSKLNREGNNRAARRASASAERRRKPRVCESCGVNPSDPPSKLCVGCQAYREHQQ